MRFATWSDGRPFGIALRKFGASGGRVIQREGALGYATEGSGYPMTSFPGTIYDADGNALSPPAPPLAQDQIDTCPHRSMVTTSDLGPVARVWLLADDATPAAIPPPVLEEAVRLVTAGMGVLILAQRPEPEVDVREALLQALDLFTATQNVAGHA